MQISKNYVLRTIAGDNLLVPLGGSSTETKGMILLNELSLFVYESIQKEQTEDEILSRILDEYDVEIPLSRGRFLPPDPGKGGLRR